jgi:hypothetical protein
VAPDLEVPPMIDAAPAAGLRVRQVHPALAIHKQIMPFAFLSFD